jgi:hypothetical protein
METMLLQHAIILGDTLKKRDPGEWLSEDGSCGCAFGGALLAAGVTAEEFHRQFLPLPRMNYGVVAEMECVKLRWPWLTEDHLGEISELYFKVHAGSRTIEDVAAYVRSIEPAAVEIAEPTETRELVTA